MRILGKALFILLTSLSLLFPKDAGRPKNIIILIGDGMGANYVSAAVLTFPNNPFKRFTSIGFSVTCSADKLVTDSAAGATAISIGYRTKNHYVGVDLLGHPLTTIFEEAERLGLSTGLVATSTITHATPAAFVSHIISRKEETEIARQFVNIDLDVVIGGGAKYFSRVDSITSTTVFSELIRKDYKIYETADELLKSDPTSKFYALLEHEEIKKASERDYSLSDLTQKAITLLSQNENGFILMVEGSQIDWAGHDNNQDYLLSELNDFCGAVNTALNFAEENQNTLVLVTADHETGGMSIQAGKPDTSQVTLLFTTKGHSAEMVGVFAKGPEEDQFRGILDNYMIGRKLFYLLNPEYQF